MSVIYVNKVTVLKGPMRVCVLTRLKYVVYYVNIWLKLNILTLINTTTTKSMVIIGNENKWKH